MKEGLGLEKDRADPLLYPGAKPRLCSSAVLQRARMTAGTGACWRTIAQVPTSQTLAVPLPLGAPPGSCCCSSVWHDGCRCMKEAHYSLRMLIISWQRCAFVASVRF